MNSLMMNKTGNNINKQEIITTNNIPGSVKTWADSIYPYFTSEYYYAGQIVTTVAVITTATVIYFYIAPAIAGYYNMPAQTNNGIDTIKPSMENTTAETNNDIDTIKPLIENTPPETKMNNDINIIKPLMENTTIETQLNNNTSNNTYTNIYETQIQHKIKEIHQLPRHSMERVDNVAELIKLTEDYLVKVKNSETYKNPNLDKVKQLIMEYNNKYWSEYVNRINIETYKNNIQAYGNHYKHIKTLENMQLKQTEAALIPQYQKTAILSIENKVQIDPEILKTFVEDLTHIEDVLPIQVQYIPRLLTFAYNTSVCYYAMKYKPTIPFELKETNIQ